MNILNQAAEVQELTAQIETTEKGTMSNVQVGNKSKMISYTIDYKIIMEVVNHFWRVEERIGKLKELGYTISSEWVSSGGVGTIRKIRKQYGVQVSAARGGNGFVGKAFIAF